MKNPLDRLPDEDWKFVSGTRRWYGRKNQKFMVVGGDGPYWYFLFQDGKELEEKDGFALVDER